MQHRNSEVVNAKYTEMMHDQAVNVRVHGRCVKLLCQPLVRNLQRETSTTSYTHRGGREGAGGTIHTAFASDTGPASLRMPSRAPRLASQFSRPTLVIAHSESDRVLYVSHQTHAKLLSAHTPVLNPGSRPRIYDMGSVVLLHKYCNVSRLVSIDSLSPSSPHSLVLDHT